MNPPSRTATNYIKKTKVAYSNQLQNTVRLHTQLQWKWDSRKACEESLTATSKVGRPTAEAVALSPCPELTDTTLHTDCCIALHTSFLLLRVCTAVTIHLLLSGCENKFMCLSPYMRMTSDMTNLILCRRTINFLIAQHTYSRLITTQNKKANYFRWSLVCCMCVHATGLALQPDQSTAVRSLFIEIWRRKSKHLDICS